MSESKQRICKFPKCHKEVSGNKSLLCGEHERTTREIIRISKKSVATGVVLLATGVGVITKMKKKN